MSTPPTPAPAPAEPKPKAPRNKYAQASVLFGIVALLALFISSTTVGKLGVGLGFVFSLAGIGTGVLGYRAAQELMKGKNWAITGIVIGGFLLLISIVRFF